MLSLFRNDLLHRNDVLFPSLECRCARCGQNITIIVPPPRPSIVHGPCRCIPFSIPSPFTATVPMSAELADDLLEEQPTFRNDLISRTDMLFFQAPNADATMNMAGSPTPAGYVAPMSAVDPLLIYLLTCLLTFSCFSCSPPPP